MADCKEVKNEDGQAEYFDSYEYDEMAHLEMKQGNYDKAQALYEKSLKISEARDDKHGIAFSYLHFADLAEKKENHEEATERRNKSIELFKEINDKGGIATVHRVFAMSA